MKKITIFSFLVVLLFVIPMTLLFAAQDEVNILVDGVPLDAKGIAVNQEVYVPAWILENYGRTRIIWKPGTSILEINTYEPSEIIKKMEGIVSVRVGFYTKEEGFVIGKNTRVYILNVNPDDLRFEGSKPLHLRAHDSTISRLLPMNEWVITYLNLSPTERYFNDGWKIISKMDKETILELNEIVDKYEKLYQDFYYDLLSTLVFEKDREINEDVTITSDSKDIKIFRLITDNEGKGKITLPNGTHFIFCRMYNRGKIILWNLPVTVKGSDISIELTNRNVTFMK